MVEQLMRVPCVWEAKGRIPEKSNLIRHCKPFATASKFTQVVILPWRYVAEMGTQSCLATGFGVQWNPWNQYHFCWHTPDIQWLADIQWNQYHFCWYTPRLI